MRKLLSLFLLLAIPLMSVSAQEKGGTSFPKNIVSVRAGGAVSKTTSRGLSTSNVGGYHIGVSDQIHASKSLPLFVETGLYATMKGYKISGYDESETKAHYLELPLLASYRIGNYKKFEVVPSAGVYAALGLSGKLKYANELVQKEIDVFKEKSLKRIDFGAQVGATLVFRRVEVGFAYDFGLIEIDKADLIYGNQPDKLGYRNLRNRTAIFRLGFEF